MTLTQKIFFSLALVVGAVSGAAAQQGSKVVFVEVVRILKEAPQVEAIKARLKTEFARRDNELVALGKQVQELQEKLQRDGAIMSAAERRRLEKDIVARQRKFKNSQTEFKEDLALRQNEELGKLRRVIGEVIQKIAKAENIDIVLESGVVAASDQANITDKVLQQLSASK